MKIIRIQAWAVPMKLAVPYTIAYETLSHVTNVFLRIDCDDGRFGVGCAAPDLSVTGETAEGTLKALLDVADGVLRGEDPLRRAQLLERLKPPLRAQPSARAAVDMALHDLLGKVADLPLWKLLGGYRTCIPTSVTIGILPSDETVERARELTAAGFRCLKLKGG